MIDYVKIVFKNIDIPRLEKLLDFKIEVNQNTGEISSKKTALYKFCKITVIENRIVILTGSIHKLWNEINLKKAPNYGIKGNNGFNGNLFTLNNILDIRNHLEKLFDCKSEQMVFKNIELGINVPLPFCPNLYLRGLLYHNAKLFEFKFNRHFAQATHQRYYLKIYNKSTQYGMNQNVLRIELKIVRTIELKRLSITTFADININTITKAKELLLKRFDEIMYYDYTIKNDSLTLFQKLLLRNYSNPRYWIQSLDPKRRDRHKKRLQKITTQFSQNISLQIRDEIETVFSRIIETKSTLCNI